VCKCSQTVSQLGIVQEEVNEWVLRRLWKTASVSAGVRPTSSGSLFQSRLLASGNARSPTVERRVWRSTSRGDGEDRRRRRLESAKRCRMCFDRHRSAGHRPTDIGRLARQAWNRCAPETAASGGLGASLVVTRSYQRDRCIVVLTILSFHDKRYWLVTAAV